MAAHEGAHNIAVLLQGGTLWAAFNRWQSAGEINETISAFAGPAVSYALMWAGALLLIDAKRLGGLGMALVFAGGPLFRLGGPGHMGGGDERWFVSRLGLDPFFALPISLLVMAPPLIIAFVSIRNRRRILWYLLFAIGMLIPLLLVGFLPDYLWLDPLVERSRLTGVPAVAMFKGIPWVVIISDLIAIVLFPTVFMRYLYI